MEETLATGIVCVQINSYYEREKIISALAESGHKVWVDSEQDSNDDHRIYVYFHAKIIKEIKTDE